MRIFHVLLGIDAAAAAVAGYFFLVGIADGSVSSFNIGIWLLLLCALAGIVGGGFFADRRGYRGTAIALLLVLAVPASLFGLFVLGLIIMQPRWN